MTEAVNHPTHYNKHPSGIECIEIAQYFDFCLGCAFKYFWRYQEKGAPKEDLEKAKWYLKKYKEKMMPCLTKKNIIKVVQQKFIKLTEYDFPINKEIFCLFYKFASDLDSVYFEELNKKIDKLIKDLKNDLQ